MKHKIPHNIGAIIFDCDGTLADTMSAHIEAWNDSLGRALNSRALNNSQEQTWEDLCQSFTPEFWDSYNGMPTKVILYELAQRFNLEIEIDAIAEEKERIAFDKLGQVGPIEEVLEIARSYRSVLPMAVVSGGVRANVMRSLEAIGVADWFGAIITADDNLPGKPAPDMFLEAARRLQVPPKDCIVLEDGVPGLIGAEKATMQILDVRPYLRRKTAEC